MLYLKNRSFFYTLGHNESISQTNGQLSSHQRVTRNAPLNSSSSVSPPKRPTSLPSTELTRQTSNPSSNSSESSASASAPSCTFNQQTQYHFRAQQHQLQSSHLQHQQPILKVTSIPDQTGSLPSMVGAASSMLGLLKGSAGNLMRNLKEASTRVLESASA
ncbi:unnamed protein product [Protopolystoma xenopodis]|uniref:Uncharacterized protein n=1 Tax=Protopolystoma xenopodis TaxID=117903 RepID=A0A3S5BN49_9PLAT|nr:unnamed protein product [Protopolystoma xenopodis]